MLAQKAHFDEALSVVEEADVFGYLARALQGPYNIDYNDLLPALRLIRTDQLGEERS